MKKKDIAFRFSPNMLIILSLILIWLSCSDEETAIVPSPEIRGLESKYIIFEDSVLELNPEIINKENASYSWILNGSEVSSEFSYLFSSEKHGEFSLTFEVLTEGGKAQKEISIIVISNGSPPIISGIDDEYDIDSNEELMLYPKITSESEVTYVWLCENEEVGNSAIFTFITSQPGSYELILKAINKGGTSEKRTTIKVAAQVTSFETKTYTLLTLKKPSYFTSENEVLWEVISSPSELFRLSHFDSQTDLFIAAVEGEYILKVTGGEIEGKVIITVEKPTKQPSPYISKVFDYMPAPGQFVNKLPEYEEGDTHDDMVRKANEWLVGEDAWTVTLGGWGGYVVFGFDHTIVNVAGKRDFRINGNAFGSAMGRPGAPFGGSCEPGIIMVAYDKNKNGKPDDDEWYEIKGSANFTAKNEAWYNIAMESGNDTRVIRDYEITYHRPESEEPEIEAQPDNPNSFASIQNYIFWEDNKDNNGYKVKNIYHNQTYYPAWIKKDQLSFKGIRLPENGINEGEHLLGMNDANVYYVLYGFRYGYADNHPNTHDGSAIDIDWAIDKEGNRVNLPGVDFVKIYSGVNQENGWLGESSTEVERGEDLHLIGKSIGTILN